jgi:hypothetical protein
MTHYHNTSRLYSFNLNHTNFFRLSLIADSKHNEWFGSHSRKNVTAKDVNSMFGLMFACISRYLSPLRPILT